MMKKNIVGKLITIISIVCITFEIGVTIGYYMLSKIDFNEYQTKYEIEVFK